MTHIRIIVLLICFQQVSVLFAQQENQYSQYVFNQAITNPAYIGSINYINMQLAKRHQWVGFPGAPQSNVLTFAYPFKYFNTAVGFTALHDNIGPLKNTVITLGYAYSLKAAHNIRLSMGINAGINHYSANLDELHTIDAEDMQLEGGTEQFSSLAVGAGVFLYSTDWFVGLSIPKTIPNKFSFNNNEGELLNLKEKLHLYLISGYVFKFDRNKYQLKPSVCLKKVSNVSPAVDVNLAGSLHNRVAVGIGFRNLHTLTSSLQVGVNKYLNVGYAFEISNSHTSKFSSGTHEIMIDIRLYNNTTKVHSPRFF